MLVLATQSLRRPAMTGFAAGRPCCRRLRTEDPGDIGGPAGPNTSRTGHPGSHRSRLSFQGPRHGLPLRMRSKGGLGAVIHIVQQFAASGCDTPAVSKRGAPPEPPEPDTPRVTRTDRKAPIWLRDDQVFRLRWWASEDGYLLPGPDVTEVVIGADPSAVNLLLVDPTRSVSRRHARLVRHGNDWQLEDLDSRTGISVDGVAGIRRALLTPGAEIGIGGITLVAENHTLVRVRDYLGRILGRGADRGKAIDLAMRAIRTAAYRRAPLVIVGVDDLVAVARQIHLRTTVPGSPFVVCGKRLYDADRYVRVTATLTDASAALAAAAGGTVCVRYHKRPVGYDLLEGATLETHAAAQLYICARKASQAPTLVKTPIMVPKLSARIAELPQIVMEYALEAMRDLGASPATFTEHERDWVARQAASYADIEIFTLWIVARNAAGGVPQAAERLGVSPAVLGDWFRRAKGLIK
jgi:hypothetical protein